MPSSDCEFCKFRLMEVTCVTYLKWRMKYIFSIIYVFCPILIVLISGDVHKIFVEWDQAILIPMQVVQTKIC